MTLLDSILDNIKVLQQNACGDRYSGDDPASSAMSLCRQFQADAIASMT
jgi:hypothetical protein